MIDSDSEDESHSRPKDPNAITQEQEEEFNRELAKMMANTGGEIRKAPERKTGLLDVGVPFVRKSNSGSSSRFARGEVDEEVIEGESEKKGMMFTLLTKKGNKQQVSDRISYMQNFDAYFHTFFRLMLWKFLLNLLSLYIL